MLATDGEGGRRSGISGTAGDSWVEFIFAERGREGERGRDRKRNQRMV